MPASGVAAVTERRASVAPTASVRELLAAARRAVDGPVDDAAGVPLEARHAPSTPPRIAGVTLLEAGEFARVVPGDVSPVFGGFLDGVQESRVVAWHVSGAPIVLAVVGAVVLVRNADRRLVAWGDGARVRRVLVVPRALLDDSTWDAMAAAGAEDSGATREARHPDALLACAVERVDTLRAFEERALAERWARGGAGPLAVDGGIASLGAASRSTSVAGIVKSHRTIHAAAQDLPALFALPVGARTRAFAIAETGGRAPVWSWYVRLRAATASNPLHGLVRVEVAPRDGGVPACADDVSRWVMAERTPIAYPDARWDVMSYGIARCEAYLKRGLALRAQQ